MSAEENLVTINGSTKKTLLALVTKLIQVIRVGEPNNFSLITLFVK
jgi:hypothetical protein